VQRINCYQCVHHFITYQPQHPYGCKVYGFKSKQMPSLAVFESSGKPCQSFEQKPKPLPKN
jgi:hypothetical protein